MREEKDKLTVLWEKSDEYDNALSSYISNHPAASLNMGKFLKSREYANGRYLFRKRISGDGDGNNG